MTGGLRIGVSARLAKAAVAALGATDAQDIELIWPGLSPPYIDLFAWLEGHGDKPATTDPAPFRPPMLAHALDEPDLATLVPAEFMAEWKWDGIRVQAVAAPNDGGTIARLYSRTGENISRSFPDLTDALHLPGAIDGELLIMRDRRVQTFNVLQQRLNRKSVTAKLMAEFPAHLRAYDLLADGDEDLRELPFVERRKRLEAFIARLNEPRVDLSPLVSFAGWDELTAARNDPAAAGAGADADAVEGIMLKRRDALYVPGRPKGPWWKWKRDPFIVDAVLMYAQRGHGKRSSYYSDYTFGVWTRGDQGDELVPVGKAYFGFTDEELLQIDRFVRRNTVDRFGPVREVVHEASEGLVLEVAFEGLQRSTGTSPGWRCGFRGSVGCAGTSRRAKPTGWSGWRQYWRASRRGVLRKWIAAMAAVGSRYCAALAATFVTSSNGQRARGAVSSGSVSPSASRSAPAQAIMAPLSVHNAGGGATSATPTSNATRCRTLRIAWLAATPPAQTSAVGVPMRSRKIRSPMRNLSMITSLTAC